MLKGIVGIELVELQIVGKVKLSQNRPEVDRQRVAAGLATGSPDEQAIAAAVARSADAVARSVGE